MKYYANIVPLSLESKNWESEFGFCLYFSCLVGALLDCICSSTFFFQYSAFSKSLPLPI